MVEFKLYKSLLYQNINRLRDGTCVNWQVLPNMAFSFFWKEVCQDFLYTLQLFYGQCLYCTSLGYRRPPDRCKVLLCFLL